MNKMKVLSIGDRSTEFLIHLAKLAKDKQEGYFIDPVYGKCNIKKALRDRDIRSEYEAYDFMHKSDGTLNKCKRSL